MGVFEAFFPHPNPQRALLPQETPRIAWTPTPKFDTVTLTFLKIDMQHRAYRDKGIKISDMTKQGLSLREGGEEVGHAPSPFLGGHFYIYFLVFKVLGMRLEQLEPFCKIQ